MARTYEHFVECGEGKDLVLVGYSFTMRGEYFGIRFVGPDGKRLERMTGHRRKNENLVLEAAKLIRAEYLPALPVDLARVGFAEALEEVIRTSPDLRPATILAYRKAIKTLLATMPDLHSPAEVTDAIASRFLRVWMAGTFKRGKASDAKQYKRSPVTASFYLRALSALWGQFRDLGYASSNPWKDVRKPQQERKRKLAPTEEDFSAFFTWVGARYPQWERLRALLELKALSGCRTSDICQLRSNQLRDGRIVWEAAQTKTREGRAVLLPPELYAKLKAVAGPTFLWEGWPEDLKRFRPSRKRVPAGFRPQNVYNVVNNLFREFSEAHPDRPRFCPHGFRRRAITLMVMATGSVDATAQAVGINPQTARGIYIDTERAFKADEVYAKLASILVPTLKPAEGGKTTGE